MEQLIDDILENVQFVGRVMITTCQQCKKTIDLCQTPFSQYDTCDGYFCSVMRSACFSQHIRKDGCKGGHFTCLDPSWKVNFKE